MQRTILLAGLMLGLAACGPGIEKKGSNGTPNNKNNANGQTNSDTNSGTNGETNSGTNSATNAGTNNPTNNISDPPCMETSAEVAFGTVPVGETRSLELNVVNCSEDANLDITDVTVEGPFTIDLPSDLVLGPAEGTAISVAFTPPSDASYSTTATFSSNAGTRDVSLTGEGTLELGCPTATIRASTGDGFLDVDELQVEPSATVELSANTSTSPNGDIVGYDWAILSRPTGSTARFSPNGQVSDPSLFLDLAGTYEVELNVTDSAGETSCSSDQLTLHARPDGEHAVRVQLVWDTPMDQDQTDMVGADLDLHYLHPDGSWDQDPWDCMWRNADPDWPPLNDPLGNPQASPDDTDGMGPEEINHTEPEDVIYRVGVHYYNDNGFGPSNATVKIWVGGQLLLESENVPLMETGKFWYGITVEPFARDAADTRQISDGFP